MSAAAAGGMLMWMAGLALGVGLMASDYSVAFAGALLSLCGVVYIRRFAEAADR
jgi:hypothetical protein